jgi:hypothetical protein
MSRAGEPGVRMVVWFRRDVLPYLVYLLFSQSFTFLHGVNNIGKIIGDQGCVVLLASTYYIPFLPLHL